MTPQLLSRRSSGYSLLEAMLVMGIVGILSMTGVSQFQSRNAGAVRTLMDEVEGALGNAHRAATATGRDTALVTWGLWNASSPLVLAHGDAAIVDADIQKVANGTAPSATLTSAQVSSVAAPFRYLAGDRVHLGARIVTIGSTEWANAGASTSSGAKNVDITTVQPFATAGVMSGLVVDANLLFPEDSSLSHRVLLSGSNKRFLSTFIIPIVGTTDSGRAIPGGPMGLIVVLANGGTIFKFYNPGIRDGDGQWRRI